jgi:RNA-directed DNA polymerase
MATGREESDGRKVPEDRRKAVSTADASRGGKATTASEQAGQLDLFRETADSPEGIATKRRPGLPGSAKPAKPKSRTNTGNALPAMTIEEVAREDNLRVAFERVASNHGAPGPDRQTIEVVAGHFERILPKLHRELLKGSYQPGQIRRVWIPKPGGGERGLGIPNVVDRIVQQAVSQVLSPHYDPEFHESSHGFRSGRSCHTAITEAREHLSEGYEWVVDMDLSKFFDRVNHERLLARLGEGVQDLRLLTLVRRMLKAKVVMPDGVVVSTDEGTPQGGPLSPLLSNIVLDELDAELERRGHRFVRYADDCNIYVRSERAGERVMASLIRFIEGRLKLKVNADKSAVARPEERHFLGFTLRPNPAEDAVEVLLSKRSKDRIDEKVRDLTPRAWGQSLRDCISGINEYLLGWIGFFGICTEAEVQKLHNLDAHIRRRLRAIILRHWRRRRKGTGPRGRSSLWTRARSWKAHRKLPNAFFAERGLVSLEEAWRRRQPMPVTAPAQLELGWT